jgi:glyoxylase-like metal-dependent hydrolase (beta-lactamase superfamily II)
MPSPDADIRRLRPDLYLIPLPVPLAGFEGFINAWVYTGGPVMVVDVGPAVSAGYLLKALTQMGIRHLDLILLTHIHIDHAGGAAAVASAFPGTPVVCHPEAAPHLVDPQKLWEGSLKTLGDVAQAYQRMLPVPARQVWTSDQLDLQDLVAVETLGHSPHHCSFLVGDLLFAGEAGGVCIDVGAPEPYMRPATPPKLYLETYLEGIDRLTECHPASICYGHIGWQPGAVNLLNLHRDQLLRWRDLIAPFHAADQGTEGSGGTLSAVYRHLMDMDPLLAGFERLDPAARNREQNFLINSIRGFWGYLDRLAQTTIHGA